MKKTFYSILIVCGLQSFLLTCLTAQTQEKITNQDVIQLVRSGVSDEVIIAKIKSSLTSFDMSMSSLKDLLNNKVSDAIILVMLDRVKPANESVTETEVTIPDGTTIEIVLKNDLSGQYAKVGDIVHFTVVRDVQIDGITVIEKDSSATAKITVAKRAGYWGRKGRLGWKMEDIMTVSGQRIPVRFDKKLDGETKTGTVAVATVTTAVALWPIAPVALLWGVKKGLPANIPAGNHFSVYVDGTTKINVKLSKK